MGSAIPPMMKPTMMSVTATQETGRPWCSSCPYVWPVCASRPCAPVSPTTVPDAGCSVTRQLLSLVNAPIILREVRD